MSGLIHNVDLRIRYGLSDIHTVFVSQFFYSGPDRGFSRAIHIVDSGVRELL
ncbi:hypothetical protein D3C85_1826510 [compost metagenome]